MEMLKPTFFIAIRISLPIRDGRQSIGLIMAKATFFNYTTCQVRVLEEKIPWADALYPDKP
jgi:hypothetical protein